jgi:PAS domain S-box-containing protein
MKIIELIHNLALLIALTSLSGFVLKNKLNTNNHEAIVRGLIFGLVALIGMIYPMQFSEGLIFDGRSVVTSICALFFGPVSAAIVVALTLTLRIIQGGSGLIMGVSVIISSALIGLLFHYKIYRIRKSIKIRELIALGLIVHVTMVLLIFTLPKDLVWQVMNNIALLAMTVFPISTVIIGKIISDYLDRNSLIINLEASEKKFRAIFNSISDGLALRKITRETMGEFVDINNSFCELLGYSEEELRMIPKERYVDPEVIKSFPYILQEVYDKGSVSFKTQHKTKSGDLIPVEINGSLFSLLGEDFFVGVTRDISERGQAEEILRSINLKMEKLTDELKSSNKDLEQFAYIASHDLKEPLRMISSFTQLLEQNYSADLNKEAKEYMKFIIDGAYKMQILINDLLNFSRINTQGEIFKEVDLNLIVEDVIKIFQDKLDNLNGSIQFENLPVIFGDGSQLRQLFQNLIGNGLKFIKEDTSPMIEISSAESDEDWTFSVKDNGIGIDSKHREKIFELFHRLHDRSKFEGTGIGLSFCKQILKKHKGKIWVESEPGIGSTFKFTIHKESIISSN